MMMTLFDDEQILKAYTNDIKREAAREAAKEAARETAAHLIKKGKMSLEEIKECVPALSLEELKELESEVLQLV